MSEQDFDIKQKILEADSPGNAVHAIYQVRKSQNSHITLSYLCRKCGIPSTGNLSDFFTGKRPLNAKYADKLLEVLNIPKLEQEYLICWQDSQREKNAKLKKQLNARLTELRCPSGQICFNYLKQFVLDVVG